MAAAALTHIRFEPHAAAGARILATFTDPEARVATAATVGPEAIDRLVAGELLVLCVPAGCPDEASWRRKAEEWTDTATASADGVSIVWQRGRAAIFGPADRMDAALAAVAEFAWYEGHLARVEAEVAADWAVLEQITPLAQDVSSKDLALRPALAAATAQTLQRRMCLARIERRLHVPAPSLGAAAVKLGRRLREEADVEARLETLDGQVETYEYVCEMANQRMGEYRNFSREFMVEILIVIILAFEAALLVLELWRTRGQ